MSKWDDPLTSVLRGETLTPPPIWFMRQAGRYLPEYREVRAKHPSFVEFCLHPEDAAEVTLQPIRRFDVDAAILFADILLIPHAIGQGVRFAAGEGPLLEPVVSPQLLDRFDPTNVLPALAPVFETVERVRAALPKEKALIGFAGAPWTVATYMINGQGTKDPAATRRLVYSDPEMIDRLVTMLVDATADYLIAQAKAGANALKLFDSWAAGLPEDLFRKLCLEPSAEIAKRVKAAADVPIIYLPKGAGPLYTQAAENDAFDGIALDFALPPSWARDALGSATALQGGLDPLLVVQGGPAMERAAKELLETFKSRPYIFNCGHGFVPETPPEHVAELVRIIRSF
ncbi:MAG: uroporphyrinogen decarboxylase [Pseudomonadota bacterium]